MQKVKIGVLVSGSGSNLQSIIDQIEQGRLQAEIKVVISNNPEAYALERAARRHLAVQVVSQLDFQKREDFDRQMTAALQACDVELVVLAGFMRVLTPLFLGSFPGRIMNIHPALLPAFPGLHVQQQALDYGVKFTGCTVHFVDEGVDTGPIIIQAVVPVFDDDTADTLAARILREEHRIYPQAIQLYAEGRLAVQGRKVVVTGVSKPEVKALHNPSLGMFATQNFNLI
ncbi:MAG: phosphoribosylglycinamide formyltransferase [Deltaproteobacteria bacterium]|nr:phosphoribosylglycinamide formyltransferase [Deltaproteobacteria bacterium]